MQALSTCTKAGLYLIVTLLAVPSISALKNDWTEVDNISRYSRISVWLFPDHANGQRKFTGHFGGVTPDAILIDAERPRNRLRIKKSSIKRVAVEWRSGKGLRDPGSAATTGVIYVSSPFVVAPSPMETAGSSQFRTVYRNTGKPPALDTNAGPPVELIKTGAED